MKMTRRLVVLTCALSVSGCQSVKVKFVTAAPGNDPAQLAKLAAGGYSYFVFPKYYVLVAPTASGDSKQGKPTPKTDGAAAPADNGGAAAALASPTSGADASAGPDAAHGDGKSSSTKKTKQTKKPKAAAGSGDAAPVGNDSATGKPAASTNADTPPPVFNNPLAAVTIDNQSWSASVVPMPDLTQAFYAQGVSGFFEMTTLGIAHYQNSDIVSSVSVVAQNLVPTRIGQIGSAIASIVTIAAAVGVSSAEPTALTPFSLEVPENDTDRVGIDTYWSYKLQFDPKDQPAGTVTLDQWKQLIANGATVNYWPVPACRTATLTLTNPDLDLAKKTYQFRLVVASQKYIRLEPLPLSGKLELGTVCGSSTNGTTTVDTLGNVSDDLSAVQTAIQQIKDAKKGTTPSSGSGSK